MRYFNWRHFALIYTDDKAMRKCYSIAEGLRKAIAHENIVNVYNIPIDHATVQDEEIDKFLEEFPKLTRSKCFSDVVSLSSKLQSPLSVLSTKMTFVV